MTMPRPTNGCTISHYRLLKPLGGRRSAVYEAEDTRLGRRVTLKFLPDELERDPQALERYQREAQAASAMLNHPNVCSIYDIDQYKGQHFIAMELLEGEPLASRIAGRPVPTDQFLEWAIQIAQALDAAHAKGIVHRSINPWNVLITRHGQVKVMDFGLTTALGSRQLDENMEDMLTRAGVSQRHLTNLEKRLWTVAYMSPEQARDEEVDARTDLFSFGTVVYEMATGQPAFRAKTVAATIVALLRAQPKPPVRLNPGLPPELQQIILKCLRHNRSDRYQAADQVLADLKRRSEE